MRALPVVLLLALAACDSQAPDPTASAAFDGPPVTAASVAQGEAFFVTEAASVGTEGDLVVLSIEGETFAFDAGQAYLLGQALASAGYVSLDEERAAIVRPPKGGDRCEPPAPGTAVAVINGRLFAGGECPPPPPPMFFDLGHLDALLAGAVEVAEATEEAEWMRIPGGFVADF